MNKFTATTLAIVVNTLMGGIVTVASAADSAREMTPVERVDAVEKGQLKSPLSSRQRSLRKGNNSIRRRHAAHATAATEVVSTAPHSLMMLGSTAVMTIRCFAL